MLRAGRVGFDAVKYAQSDGIPWQTVDLCIQTSPWAEYWAMSYTPKEYFSVDTDRQSEIALSFLQEHHNSIRELQRLDVPTTIYLQRAWSSGVSLDILTFPNELLKTAQALDIDVAYGHYVHWGVESP